MTPVATSHRLSSGGYFQPWSLMAYAIPLDTSPYQIVDTMQLHKVDNVFRLLKLNQAYVTRSGKLVGIVTRSIIREYMEKHTEKQKKWGDCLINAILSCCCRKDDSYSRIDSDDSVNEEKSNLLTTSHNNI
jgi:hypothetical protein